jgi:heme exporter protein B
VRLRTLIVKECLDGRQLRGGRQSLLFALVLVVLTKFSLPDLQGQAVCGVFWLIFTFAGTFVLSQAFAYEERYGLLAAYKLCGVSPEIVYLSKWLYLSILLTALGLALWLLSGLMLDAKIMIGRIGPISLVIATSAMGFAALGVLLAALARRSRRIDWILTLIFYPLIIPLVIASIQLSQAVLETGRYFSHPAWAMLLATDLIFLAISTMLVDFSLED